MAVAKHTTLSSHWTEFSRTGYAPAEALILTTVINHVYQSSTLALGTASLPRSLPLATWHIMVPIQSRSRTWLGLRIQNCVLSRPWNTLTVTEGWIQHLRNGGWNGVKRGAVARRSRRQRRQAKGCPFLPQPMAKGGLWERRKIPSRAEGRAPVGNGFW